MYGLKIPKRHPIWPPTVVPGRHEPYLVDPCGYLKENNLFQMALDTYFCHPNEVFTIYSDTFRKMQLQVQIF